jgi:hypothetical protein
VANHVGLYLGDLIFHSRSVTTHEDEGFKAVLSINAPVIYALTIFIPAKMPKVASVSKSFEFLFNRTCADPGKSLLENNTSVGATIW